MPDLSHETIRIEIASSPADFAAGAALILEYRSEFYDILRLQNIDKELQELEERYSPPNSRFFLLKEQNKAVACAILKRFSEEAVELKRMFITPEARGKGYGRALLKHTIQNAKDLGFRRMVLDTEPVMASAIQLYEKYGFQKRDAYYNSPLPNVIFYELQLNN